MSGTGDWPPLLAPGELEPRLDEPGLRLVDLAPPEQYAGGHLPGAINLPYGRIVRHEPPVVGLLPDERQLRSLLDRLGIGPDTRVVAMDAEGGAAAGRFLWTLHCLGHSRCSMLDGGLPAWTAAGLPVTREPASPPEPCAPARHRDERVIADAEFIRSRLGDADFRLLDARSAGEYDGSTQRAARGGHVPGARHYEWTRGIDPDSLRMRPGPEILRELAALDVTPEHEVVVYCHSHHRSGYSYWMLHALGFPRVRGYPGSWSDWGNREDLPVESGA